MAARECRRATDCRRLPQEGLKACHREDGRPNRLARGQLEGGEVGGGGGVAVALGAVSGVGGARDDGLGGGAEEDEEVALLWVGSSFREIAWAEDRTAALP